MDKTKNPFFSKKAPATYSPELVRFRGKSVETGEWVYGWFEMYSFGRWPLKPSIIPAEEANDGICTHIEIDPDTLGMFTGLYDLDGDPIYTGDIVKNHMGFLQVVCFEHGRMFFRALLDFVFNEHDGESFCACAKRYETKEENITKDYIVGNIFDNPEFAQKYLD